MDMYGCQKECCVYGMRVEGDRMVWYVDYTIYRAEENVKL